MSAVLAFHCESCNTLNDTGAVICSNCRHLLPNNPWREVASSATFSKYPYPIEGSFQQFSVTPNDGYVSSSTSRNQETLPQFFPAPQTLAQFPFRMLPQTMLPQPNMLSAQLSHALAQPKVLAARPPHALSQPNVLAAQHPHMLPASNMPVAQFPYMLPQPNLPAAQLPYALPQLAMSEDHNAQGPPRMSELSLGPPLSELLKAQGKPTSRIEECRIAFFGGRLGYKLSRQLEEGLWTLCWKCDELPGRNAVARHDTEDHGVFLIHYYDTDEDEYPVSPCQIRYLSKGYAPYRLYPNLFREDQFYDGKQTNRRLGDPPPKQTKKPSCFKAYVPYAQMYDAETCERMLKIMRKGDAICKKQAQRVKGESGYLSSKKSIDKLWKELKDLAAAQEPTANHETEEQNGSIPAREIDKPGPSTLTTQTASPVSIDQPSQSKTSHSSPAPSSSNQIAVQKPSKELTSDEIYERYSPCLLRWIEDLKAFKTEIPKWKSAVQKALDRVRTTFLVTVQREINSTPKQYQGFLDQFEHLVSVIDIQGTKPNVNRMWQCAHRAANEFDSKNEKDVLTVKYCVQTLQDFAKEILAAFDEWDDIFLDASDKLRKDIEVYFETNQVRTKKILNDCIKKAGDLRMEFVPGEDGIGRFKHRYPLSPTRGP